MEPIRDREGWQLSEGSRCYRFTREGRRLRHQVIVTGLRDDGNVEIDDLHTLAPGVVRPDRLQLLARTKETPGKVLRYKLAKETIRQASEISQRRRGRARR